MPGYKKDRFVNLSENDKAELTCSICQDILCTPLVAQCCQQSFCWDCINDWLKNNKTCPYDRKTLMSSELTHPPRIMLYMLGKLKISCDYKENGCKEVLLLENLSQHTLNCRYDKNCKNCLCEILDKSGHDCIKTLLEKIKRLELNCSTNLVSPTAPQTSGELLANVSSREQSLLRENCELKAEKENFLKTIQELSNNTEQQNSYSANILQYSLREESLLSEICQLKTEKEALMKENGDLKVEKDNFIKTIQELSNNTEQQNSLNTSSFGISQHEIFKQARKHILTPEVIKIVMNDDIKKEVLSIIKKEILKENKNSFDLCKNIKEKLDTQFGWSWCCIASYQQNIKSFSTYEEGYLIHIKFAELYLKIYRNHYNFLQMISNGKIKRQIQILGTDMNDNMVSDVKEITFRAIEKSESLNEIGINIAKKLSKKYQGNWQCFLYAHFGSFSIRKKLNTYIMFNVDSLTLTLFQAII